MEHQSDDSETLEGIISFKLVYKSTFHSTGLHTKLMNVFTRIPRLNSCVLDLQCVPGGSLSAIEIYTKPTQRPDPCLLPPTTLEELEGDQGGFISADLMELIYGVSRSGILEEGNMNIPP